MYIMQFRTYEVARADQQKMINKRKKWWFLSFSKTFLLCLQTYLNVCRAGEHTTQLLLMLSIMLLSATKSSIKHIKHFSKV